MDRLWQELSSRKIPISVVVYPWPAQVVHDTADSLQVRIWREWCDGKCKRFISLFPEFLAARTIVRQFGRAAGIRSPSYSATSITTPLGTRSWHAPLSTI